MLMLVVNWAYLVLASQRTERLCDILSETAVYELLDEGRLQDQGVIAANQTDDVANATTAISNPIFTFLPRSGDSAGSTFAAGFLKANNDAIGPSLRINFASDMTITAGRVENATARIASPGNPFIPFASLPPGQPANTLRVEILRTTGGANPAQLLIRGFDAPNAAKISGASYATLDNRLIGFRPTAMRNSPVVPLAIDLNAWFTARPAGALDSNGNGRRELDVTLKPSDTGANGALVQLNTASLLNPAALAALPAQIQNGIGPADVASGFLGPAAQTAPPTLLTLSASQDSPPKGAAIVAAFSAVAVSKNPRRIFPLYNSVVAGPPATAKIIGFVGATVVGAFSNDGDADADDVPNRVIVRIEPVFIIDHTAVTAYTQGGLTVPENTYIHKIHLTR